MNKIKKLFYEFRLEKVKRNIRKNTNYLEKIIREGIVLEYNLARLNQDILTELKSSLETKLGYRIN